MYYDIKNSIFVFRCERGFVLSGGERTMARDCLGTGEWTGEAPTCSYVDCGVPAPLENGKIELKVLQKITFFVRLI